jgi:integrase
MLFSVYARYVPNLTRKDGSAMERLLASNIDGFHEPEMSNKKQADDDFSVSINQAQQNETEELAFWDQFLTPNRTSSMGGRH